ncbi:MAG: hydrogenase [Candidatus Margulisiibacteriota bacterium]|nr:MAG: hydrogenase [Candidatus Margulisiibacteriota bacterium]HCT85929.1 hydrogenase [Candidatus Margulisiibacteriota bacterium]HCY35902.1 hydrogenase [Candidatus Margulisiibacteriota bacterium]
MDNAGELSSTRKERSMLLAILNILFLLIVPFLFIGIINRTKAFWAGRRGAPVIQPIYDFIKLINKGEVISTTSSYIFKVYPVITYASIIFAGLLIPIISHKSVLDFKLNFILFAYILAFGKFFALIGAMDTGSSFEGIGASREVTFSTIAEPAFFIVIASFVALTGNYSFNDIFLFLQKSNTFVYLITVLSAVTFFIILLVEGSRVPVDDPNTHLELTMIHEVMVLDNSGPDLAFICHGAAIKMTIFAILIANLLLPERIGIIYSSLLLLVIISAISIVIGTIESLVARLRMTHVPQFIFISISVSLIMLSATLLFIYGGAK